MEKTPPGLSISTSPTPIVRLESLSPRILGANMAEAEGDFAGTDELKTSLQRTADLIEEAHRLGLGGVPSRESTPSAMWNVCCRDGRTQRSFLRYVVQVFIGIATIAFCMAMIVTDSEGREVWLSLMTAVIGVFLPSPVIGGS